MSMDDLFRRANVIGADSPGQLNTSVPTEMSGSNDWISEKQLHATAISRLRSRSAANAKQA